MNSNHAQLFESKLFFLHNLNVYLLYDINICSLNVKNFELPLRLEYLTNKSSQCPNFDHISCQREQNVSTICNVIQRVYDVYMYRRSPRRVTCEHRIWCTPVIT